MKALSKLIFFAGISIYLLSQGNQLYAQRARYVGPPPRPAYRPAPRPVPVRPVPVPVPVRRPVVVVPVPYHHPYVYHPFVPYYWGPYWHPISFIAATLTTAAIIITINEMTYHYDSGVYYEETSGGYKVIPAPIGASIDKLPSGYTKIDVNSTTYYYYGGDYYIKSESKYKVVKAPVGAVITKLPEGAKEETVDGNKCMVYNGVYYQPISNDGEDAYTVIEKK